MNDERLEPWQMLARREVLHQPPWMRIWSERLQLPDGRVIDDWLTIEMPNVAVVVAITLAGDVVVERSYRHGPRRVSISLPAGHIDPGEEPLAAAQRELLEETGYVADEWELLGEFTRDGNRGCGRAFLFLARAARLVAEPSGDDLEEMVIERMSPDELLSACRQGSVTSLTSAAAIGFALATGRM